MAWFLLAGAGYGKTAALRRRFPAHDWCAWPEGLDRLEHGGGQIVIDDLPALSQEEATRLVSALHGDSANDIAIASRHPLPVSIARLRGRGQLTVLGPGELALTPDEVATLLDTEYSLADPDLADQVHALTAGWPALIHLTAAGLAAGGSLLPEPGGPLWTYVEDEILTPFACRLTGLDPITPELVAALGHSPAELATLTATGVVVAQQIVPIVAHVARGGPPAAESLGKAAQWYEEHGLPAAALRLRFRRGDTVHCGRIIAEHGEAILHSGHASLLREVLTAGDRDRQAQLLLGDALRTTGQVMAAAQAYAVIADGEAAWDAGVAWRMGLVHYLRGDSRAALKAFARGPSTLEGTDGALLLAWRACAHLQLGETATATELAELAVSAAAAAGDDSVLATAYVSLALCHNMSGNSVSGAELSEQALALAGRAGNIVLRARILTTQTFELLGEARYAEALACARETAHSAAVAGHTNLRSLALCNEGDALLMLGRYDDAARQYERAQALCRRMGSRRSAAAQLGLGEIYRRRGWPEQARAAYESAIQLAEEAGLSQIHVTALAGLSRAMLPSNVDAATEAADKAVRLATARAFVPGLLARGWVALHASRDAASRDAVSPVAPSSGAARPAIADAAQIAAEAAALARAERDPAGLAEALELQAATSHHPRPALREALAIWTTAEAVVEAARVRVALGALSDADTDDRLGALIASETLHHSGVPVPRRDSPVEIRTFGRFEVCLDGKAVPPTQWQSRKARELLRILVSRRGRPVPRGELCELLWPDDDPGKTGHRLSVLLSIVRGVLDPAKALAQEHYVVADQASVGLDIGRLRIDVEEFLTDVGHGRRLRDRAAIAEAARLLSRAVDAYRADVFEDEPYSDWSTGLREEARAAYLSALRMLAQAHRVRGDTESAVANLLRLLGNDPYDETAHRALIEALTAAGQHGEARRARARYRDAMRAIGVRPADQYQEPMHEA